MASTDREAQTAGVVAVVGTDGARPPLGPCEEEPRDGRPEGTEECPERADPPPGTPRRLDLPPAPCTRGPEPATPGECVDDGAVCEPEDHTDGVRPAPPPGDALEPGSVQRGPGPVGCGGRTPRPHTPPARQKDTAPRGDGGHVEGAGETPPSGDEDGPPTCPAARRSRKRVDGERVVTVPS